MVRSPSREIGVIRATKRRPRAPRDAERTRSEVRFLCFACIDERISLALLIVAFLLGDGIYGLFPLAWDNDPHIVFHGTNLDNLDSILEHGFLRMDEQQLRVSFGKTSGYALYHWWEKWKRGW